MINLSFITFDRVIASLWSDGDLKWLSLLHYYVGTFVVFNYIAHLGVLLDFDGVSNRCDNHKPPKPNLAY